MKQGPQRLILYLYIQVPDFGICIDIDGVLVRGHDPLPTAVEAMKCLEGKVPVAFVTNNLSRDAYKAYHLGSMLGIKVSEWVLDLRSKRSGVRFALLVMYRNVRQPSYSILPLLPSCDGYLVERES